MCMCMQTSRVFESPCTRDARAHDTGLQTLRTLKSVSSEACEELIPPSEASLATPPGEPVVAMLMKKKIVSPGNDPAASMANHLCR